MCVRKGREVASCLVLVLEGLWKRTSLQVSTYFPCSAGSPLQHTVLQDSGIAGSAPGPSHSSGPKSYRTYTQGTGRAERQSPGLLGSKERGGLEAQLLQRTPL